MELFDTVNQAGHEQIVFCHNKDIDLRAIIAIHDTTLGPALGGTRMWPYATEEEALRDVLRLSRGMTYKAAVSGLNLGGGKAVIIGDPRKDKSEALFRAFGRFIDSLHGRYITAEDVGIFLRALNDGSVFSEGEQEIYSSVYTYNHTGLIPGYQSIAEYHKDIDTVVIQFVNTTNFSGYTWNLSQIVYKRIVKILK